MKTGLIMREMMWEKEDDVVENEEIQIVKICENEAGGYCYEEARLSSLWEAAQSAK